LPFKIPSERNPNETEWRYAIPRYRIQHCQVNTDDPNKPTFQYSEVSDPSIFPQPNDPNEAAPIWGNYGPPNFAIPRDHPKYSGGEAECRFRQTDPGFLERVQEKPLEVWGALNAHNGPYADKDAT
jgi:hypothetical protein